MPTEKTTRERNLREASQKLNKSYNMMFQIVQQPEIVAQVELRAALLNVMSLNSTAEVLINIARDFE